MTPTTMLYRIGIQMSSPLRFLSGPKSRQRLQSKQRWQRQLGALCADRCPASRIEPNPHKPALTALVTWDCQKSHPPQALENELLTTASKLKTLAHPVGLIVGMHDENSERSSTEKWVFLDQLVLHEASILTVHVEQLVVRALFDHFSLVQHQDLCGVLDCR